jgi:hypothetical protein
MSKSKYGQDAERIAALRATRQSDVERWSSLDSHNEGWVNRVRMAVRFIPQESRVVEIGAGRAFMRELLPPGCKYVPADLVAHQPDFLQVDLNADGWELPEADVLVALGTLEYVYDVPATLKKLASRATRLIVTYCCRVPEADAEARLRHGWLSDYTEDQMIAHLESIPLKSLRNVAFQNEAYFKQIMWVGDVR